MAFLASRNCLTVLRKGEEPFRELSPFVLPSRRKLPCALSVAAPPLYKISLWDVPAVSATTAGDYRNHRLSPFLVWNGQFCRQSSKVRHENLVIRSEWQDSMQMMHSCPIPRSSSCPWLPVSTAEILSTGLIPPLVFSYASIGHQGRHYTRCNCGRCPWNSPPVLGICW